MAIVVKCPICQQIIKLQEKPKYFFRHCGVAHPVEPNLITVGWLKPKEASKTEETNEDFIELEVEENG